MKENIKTRIGSCEVKLIWRSLVKEVGLEDKGGGNRSGCGQKGGWSTGRQRCRLQSFLPLESGDELGVLVTAREESFPWLSDRYDETTQSYP